MSGSEGGFLDGMAARGLALLIALGCAGVLGYIHRDDMFPPEKQAAAEDGVFQRCYAKRSGDITKMLKNRLVKEAQAKLFYARAEALCRDLARKASSAQAPPIRGLK